MARNSWADLRVPVAESAGSIESRGLLKRRRHDHAARIVDHAETLICCPLTETILEERARPFKLLKDNGLRRSRMSGEIGAAMRMKTRTSI